MSSTASLLGFSLRIVSVDSYMCEPVPGLDVCRSEFRKSDVKSVPVVRVFGSTPAGQTACLHVHGVFPYVMVPYCGPDMMESQWSEVEGYVQQLATGLDSALNSASGKAKSFRQRVFKIVLLRGIPFYGYHDEEELFLKIYFYLPGDIKRAAELLQAGMVLDRQFQPHEAHVPYILQLFLDYNLYGMNLLHVRNCWFRLPIGKPDAVEELPRIERPDDIPPEQNHQTKADDKENKGKDKKEDFQIPSISQLRDFNWNLLRERAQSTYSQTLRNQAETDNAEDSDLPQPSCRIRRTSKDEDSSPSNSTQSFSCSDLCKSLVSRTVSPDDSERPLTSFYLCPLHTQWSGLNVPPESKLPVDIERQSTCDLEVDVLAADVSNRYELMNASSANPGIASIWEDERARRRERNEDSQIAMDQSQPRIIDGNLSEREARHIQMLYDALDRYKEEESLASSFDDSASIVGSRTSTKSLDTIRSRHQSKDMFPSSGETATGSVKRENEDFLMSSSDTQTPTDSMHQNEEALTQETPCSHDEDLSTLELMKKLMEEEVTVATQHGNGPFDDDWGTPADVARSQNLLRRQLSLLSDSQLIASPGPFADDTQPIAPPSDDEDAIEAFEMSQRWDSAIQDLLRDLSETETEKVEDSDDEFISQIDGASDCSAKAKAASSSSKRLGATRRCRAGVKISVQRMDRIKNNADAASAKLPNLRKGRSLKSNTTSRASNAIKECDKSRVKVTSSGATSALNDQGSTSNASGITVKSVDNITNDLSSVDGPSSLKVGLWKIPPTERVTLTPELLRTYELYSPKRQKCTKRPRKRPPELPPLTKRMVSAQGSSAIDYSKLCSMGPVGDNSEALSRSATLQAPSPSSPVAPSFAAKKTSSFPPAPELVDLEDTAVSKSGDASTVFPTCSKSCSVRGPRALSADNFPALSLYATEAEKTLPRRGIEKNAKKSNKIQRSLPDLAKKAKSSKNHQNQMPFEGSSSWNPPSTTDSFSSNQKAAKSITAKSASDFMFTDQSDDSHEPCPPLNALLRIGLSPLKVTPGESVGAPVPWSPTVSQTDEETAGKTTACGLQESEELFSAELPTGIPETFRAEYPTQPINNFSIEAASPAESRNYEAPSLRTNNTPSSRLDTADTTSRLGVSCAGRGTYKVSSAGKQRQNVQQRIVISPSTKPTEQAIGGFDEGFSDDSLSPPDKQPFFSQPRGIGQAAFVYRTAGQPPTPNEVFSDLKTFGLVTNSTSKEPFYGEASDALIVSHRLSNLPPYINRPKPLKALRDIPEHHSDLPLEGDLHHWTVLATASSNYNESEYSVMREKVAEILPPQVRVWDHIDVVTKLPQFPALEKIFLDSKEIILRPAVLPPSRESVVEWLKKKHGKKQAQSCKVVESKKSKSPIKSAESLQSETSTLTPKKGRRSLSLSTPLVTTPTPHPRRVSFDLSNLPSNESELAMLTGEPRGKKRVGDGQRGVSKCSKLDPVEGSPVKSCTTKAVVTSTQADYSPLCGKQSFADSTSPVTSTPSFLDGTASFTISPATLPSIQSSVALDGDSSAIKCLVGSLDKDETSPLSFYISGSFTPPPRSTQVPASKGKKTPSSLEKLPQSTPNVAAPQERKHALRRLAFTPIIGVITPGASTSRGVSSAAVTSSQPRQVEQTPSKPTCLRKTLLAKKLYSDEMSKDEDHSPTPASQPTTKADPSPSPLVLETPAVGKRKRGSQIDGPTLDNTYGFKAAQQHLGDAKSLHVVQHITSVSMELHVKTRIDLKPDPDMDEIRCLFYCLDCDSWTGGEQGMKTGAIVVDAGSVVEDASTPPSQPSTSSKVEQTVERQLLKKSGITRLDVLYVKTEIELFLVFAQLMHLWDPDILVGYEVQMLSWGFLLQRAAHLRYDLCRAISRVPTDDQRNRHEAARDEYGADNASELHIVGRIVLNLWRLMRTEVALYDYGFESVAYHLLHERHPKYDHQTLTNWFDPPSRSGQISHVHRWRVLDYYVSRVRGSMRLLAQQDFIGRTSELARVFGIQFYEVLTRGSQFRVESMLLRTARARNLVAVTPSVLQRAQMRAPEVIALVMEPESKFYHVPVLVLDFQSLYPSIVIAHNICYSTCLGRAELLGSDAFFTFGCTALRVPAKTLNKLLRKNLISVNPSGVAFVRRKVRKGVMPQMLDEILTTRIMVKNSMKKLGPEEAATRRVLDHRQLGLKYIANLTYGYTAANFSGRMPCVEVGDSIVHKARETLERAIRLVTRGSAKWENARVVYGDTDSMFIALEGLNQCGCTKERAFEVGKEIAAAVTADNPTPVKLKFEKVYLPCVLQTKKRYVGYAFESEDQKEPVFDAKGIETVRRDGTPATAKILEKMLKILFNSRDISEVKEYVLKQCSKILDGRTTLQDCIIAKEYRGKQYYKPGAVVPALTIARKLLAMDKRGEPRVGERVPYVVVHGAPGTPLYQLTRSPLEVLKDPSLRLNGAYYVTKQILPALDRVMSLLGVDVFLWHQRLPRIMHFAHNPVADSSQNLVGKKATISQFFKSKHCLMCRNLSVQAICDSCLSTDDSRRQATAVSLGVEARTLERRRLHVEQICMQCTGASSSAEIRCISTDCPILYKRHRATDESSKAGAIRKALLNEDLL